MAKQNTATARVDPRFKAMLEDLLNKKSRKIKTPRITLAMYRQYKKYPKLLKELEEADLI